MNSSAWITPEALNVTPDLLDAPLARPYKRLLAISLDALTIALLSGFGSLWLFSAIAIASFQLWKMRAQSWKKKFLIWPILLLLLLIAGAKSMYFIEQYNSPPVLSQTAEVVEASDEISDEASSNIAPSPGNRTMKDRKRIAKLEKELVAARMPKVFQWREEIRKWGDSAAAQFGWAFIYFTFLPYWWNGQTLGKKVFGLRVVELTGKSLSIMNYLGRYGGYAAGIATGMIGFIQVLWDTNRQAIQDKIAHTVVIDLRQGRRLDL